MGTILATFRPRWYGQARSAGGRRALSGGFKRTRSAGEGVSPASGPGGLEGWEKP